MVVRTQEKPLCRSGSVGLHVGVLNAREYFPRDAETVELELDHLRIVCTLEPSFWQDMPEIHDFRLSLWLESKRSSGKLGSHAAPVAMIPNGAGSFRVQIMSKEEADYALTQVPSKPSAAVFLAPASSSGLLEPRKHDAGRTPDRRRAGRQKLLDLGRDERASVAASH
jgi:hypothetical protein